MELDHSSLHGIGTDPYRPLQPHVAHAFQASRPIPLHSPIDINGLDPNDIGFQQEFQRLQSQNSPHPQSYPDPHVFADQHGHRVYHQQAAASPHTPQQAQSLDGNSYILNSAPARHSAVSRLQDGDLFSSPSDGQDQKSTGHASTRIEVDPPNLAEWREKLFNVNEMITLSEEEFQIYFPHVDNVYSHRSTQKYKRKPFVSHYWDCRLKGRPPGTPKSDDPNKKKRKRTARERDLCDVKIKITEYFPGAMLRPDFVPDGPQGSDGANNFFAPGQGAALAVQQQQAYTGMLVSDPSLPNNHPGSTGQRYYTIQRVNGNGGNGKGDGVAGPHKHTLEESDRVKKNSVQRYVMSKEKEDKKTQKTYHKRASGAALATVKKRSKEHDLKLFGSCFCPFVQRVWIAMEAKGMQYQYIEIDPYKKPQALLDVNPRGLVPGIRHGDWGCGESTVLMEYLEDLDVGEPLLPVGNPQLRATCRLWSDHINRNITPAFYNLLQSQDPKIQLEAGAKLKEAIALLVDACPDATGPYFLGPKLSFVDIQIAPWMLRMSRVLKPYRGWPEPEEGSRWKKWIEAIEGNEHVQATTSGDELYLDSYERYADNRPGTSMLADAVNGGYSLP